MWPKSNAHDSAPVKRRRIIRENGVSGRTWSEQETSVIEKKKAMFGETTLSEIVPREQIQRKQEQGKEKEKEKKKKKKKNV